MTLRAARRAIGGGIILIMAAAAILAPWITGQDPNRSGDDILAAVTARHWFGTDDLGRDVLTRVLYGARISLLIGTSAALVATLIGVPVGLVAGYMLGTVDLFLIHVIDLFIALPGLVLALIITVAVGPSLQNLVLVLGFVMWPAVARLIRGQVFIAREMAYIDAARAIGAHTLRIVARHVWPNISRVVAAQFAVGVASAIFTASSLSFLGLGLPPPTPDWGSMVQSGFQPLLSLNPLLCLAPGAGRRADGVRLLVDRPNLRLNDPPRYTRNISWRTNPVAVRYDDIGNRLKAFRLGSGLSADEIAKRAGISRTALYRFEKGEVVKIETLDRLADLLQVSVTTLLGVGTEYIASAVSYFERMRQIEFHRRARHRAGRPDCLHPRLRRVRKHARGGAPRKHTHRHRGTAAPPAGRRRLASSPSCASARPPTAPASLSVVNLISALEIERFRRQRHDRQRQPVRPPAPRSAATSPAPRSNISPA